MAEVALRTYIEQIESMIDSGQVDEAIAHVRHILEKYPKYVDAYRVLGKAFIEKGRHQDAADIFQRVLSVEPDDFVSHVGMSIVREDESNLDGAIWHMERAYEEQPANAAIQDELKRLYERRDGLEPPRIRLTRGALARMYMKGHLHPQSVAELRAALAEDADRQDLRALLARALWDDQQRVEAAEVSNEILEDLPYCRTANRILSVAWSEGGNDEQARIYRSRLAALDPYEAHSTNGDVVFGAGQVAADSVKLTRLEYRPGVDEFSDDERPDWMQALGAEFDAPGTESDTPDWLRESAEAVASEPSAAPTATGDLPDWLQEAGAAVPAEAAAPAVASADDGDDVPDWLEAEVGAAPASEPAPTDEAGFTSEAAAEEPATDTPEWLQEAMSAPAESEPATAAESEAPDAATAATDDQLPDWLSSAPDAAPEAAAEEPAADTPEWLQEAMSTPAESEPAPAAESEAPDAATAATDDQLPDWLSSAPEAAPEAAAEEPAADTPEWLQDAMAAPTEPEPAAAEPGDEDPIPEFLRDAGWSERDPSIELDDLPPIPDDVPLAPPPGSDAPDWLQEAMGARAEPSSEEPDIEPAEIPDWLADKQPAETEPAVEAPPVPEMEAEPVEKPEWLPKSAAEDDDEQAPSPTGELPDWLADAESSPDDTIVGWLKDTQPAAAVDQPDWLRTPEEAPSEPATVDDDIPNWLRDAGGESQEAAPAQASDEPELADWLAEVEDSSGQPVVRYGATDADPFSETSDKVDTGDFESTLPAAPASDGEDMEVWVAAGTETHEPEVAADVVEPVETAAAPEPPPTDQDDALAWLEGLAAKQGAREEELITPSEERSEDMPDWVAAMAAGDGASAVEPAAQAEATESGDDGAATESEDARDWLQPQPDATPEPEIDAAALPDWLRQPESETPTAEVESEADTSPDEAEMSAATGTAPELADEDAALAWLEGLAAKQGAREEELITAPEKRTDELPAWVSEMAAGVPTNELTEDVTEPEPTMTPEVEEPVATLPVEETPEEPAEPLATELPDWLTEPRGETGALSETDGEAPALPDWLSEQGAPSAAAESAPAEFAWPGAAPESEAPEPAAAAEFELSSPPAALEPKVEVDVHAEETPEMEDEAEPARAEALPGAADQTEPASKQFEADVAAVPNIEEPAADQFEVESPVAAAPVPTAPETAVQPAKTEMDAAESMEKAPAEEAVAPAPAAQPITPAVRPARPTKRSPEEVLARARDFLADDDIERALKHYGKLLKSSDVLDTVIADLEQAASETFDAPVELLQTLGDAYMKGNQLQKALDTYRRALHSI